MESVELTDEQKALQMRRYQREAYKKRKLFLKAQYDARIAERSEKLKKEIAEKANSSIHSIS